ncbi:hypothetical protein LAZ67_13001224 [Cordylochernes scorpioides]|uniref:Uncharacterized protein n=1 Tax=Cordylochernes scorpioides TaxID=51811 RepID=A0ABY6L3M5_9ARAC|nr:hypothetical protein LAZ67_13001224 [Cordylochernes scorpioides]
MERLQRQQEYKPRPSFLTELSHNFLKVELKQRSSIVLPKQQSLKMGVINQVDSQFPRQATHTVTCGGMQRPLSHLDRMVETRSGKMQDPAQERIKAEESAKPQPGATIGRDASSDPVVLNPTSTSPIMMEQKILTHGLNLLKKLASCTIGQTTLSPVMLP